MRAYPGISGHVTPSLPVCAAGHARLWRGGRICTTVVSTPTSTVNLMAKTSPSRCPSPSSPPPAPPVDLSSAIPSTSLLFLSFPVGWDGPLHPAPRRQFAFVLAGEMEGATSDGEVRRSGPGSVFLLEDTWGKGHISRNVGNEPALLAIVQLPD